MAIKLYVAGGFDKKDEVRKVQEQAEALGWEITEDWTRHTLEDLEAGARTTATGIAYADIRGVVEADVFILLADGCGPGSYTELGAAIVARMVETEKAIPDIYIIASPSSSCIFHSHPYVTVFNSVEAIFSTPTEMLAEIRDRRKKAAHKRSVKIQYALCAVIIIASWSGILLGGATSVIGTSIAWIMYIVLVIREILACSRGYGSLFLSDWIDGVKWVWGKTRSRG